MKQLPHYKDTSKFLQLPKAFKYEKMVYILAQTFSKDIQHIRDSYDIDDYAELVLFNAYDGYIQFKLYEK